MFLQWLKSQFEIPVFIVVVVIFEKFNDDNFVLVRYGIEIVFFFLCHDLKVTWSYYLWSIIDGIIVNNLLECISVSVVKRKWWWPAFNFTYKKNPKGNIYDSAV